MKKRIVSISLGGLLLAGSLGETQAVAGANTASTAAIAAGAAAIVGPLLFDSNNRPYYVRDGHRYYVTQSEAQYYRSHHHGARNAYAPPYHAFSRRTTR